MPPAIIFINSDINASIQSTLQSQLYLDEVMSKTEFDARISVEPSYSAEIHLNGLRIMVIYSDFRDQTNRNLADLVLFYSHGQVYIEKNNYGPPGLSLPLERINIYDLLRANRSEYVIVLPDVHACKCGYKTLCNSCYVSCTSCCGCHGLGGINAIESMDSSGIHRANPDNERNNKDFINRK